MPPIRTPAHGNWLPPPSTLTLAAGEVHLWKASLQALPEPQQRWVDSLSAEERQRAERFVFERDRRRFVAGRGILRAILSRYLGQDPRAIEFAYGQHGKPTLVQPPRKRQLQFNLSHSGERGIYALAWDCPVGVDVEGVRSRVDALKLANRFFQPAEVRAIAALPATQQPQQFLRYWTGKEAYLKATGQGLAGLQEVEIEWPDGGNPQLRLHPLALTTPSDWSLYPLDVGPDYTAALVVASSTCQLRCWQWPQVEAGAGAGASTPPANSPPPPLASAPALRSAPGSSG